MDYENDTSWVRGMLQPGENLLWTGKPEKVRLLGKEDIFLIPFSLVWCGFLAFMLITTWKSNGPGIAKLFFIPFVLAGLWLLAGRFLVKLFSVKGERYALTSRRLIVKRGNTTKSSDLLSLPSMRVTRRSDGSGDICFGADFHTEYTGGFSYGRQRVYQRPEFELRGVSDVDRVEYRIRQAMDQLREAQN